MTLEMIYLATCNRGPELHVVQKLRALSDADVNAVDSYQVTAFFRAIQNTETPLTIIQFYLDEGADVHYHLQISGRGIFDFLFTYQNTHRPSCLEKLRLILDHTNIRKLNHSHNLECLRLDDVKKAFQEPSKDQLTVLKVMKSRRESKIKDLPESVFRHILARYF